MTDKENHLLENTRMSFGDHLEELRSRLIKALCGLLVGFAFCLFFGQEIIGYLSQPLLIALQESGLDTRLYIMSLPEAFLTYIKVCIYAGIFITSPWIFYQLWGFVAAGLYPHEKRYVHIFVPFSAALFVLGGIFLIWIVAPLTCNFFIKFCYKFSTPDTTHSFLFQEEAEGTPAPQSPVQSPNASANPPSPPVASARPEETPLVKPMITLQKYVSFILLLAVAFGLSFQMPLVVLLLGQLHIVEIKTFRKIRKYALFAIVIAAALLTPGPDVISQVALAVPMYLLYELGIVLLQFWPKRKASSQ
ncbi:MAG: Sec-independent protein translocase protein TatCy [Planctomycetes bacterium ADurb.Bin412]|nr:MAG: Sec-independent protein translocase protein TatCy [Planctomycetes bacterium ADurb.Bin412]